MEMGGGLVQLAVQSNAVEFQNVGTEIVELPVIENPNNFTIHLARAGDFVSKMFIECSMEVFKSFESIEFIIDGQSIIKYDSTWWYTEHLVLTNVMLFPLLFFEKTLFPVLLFSPHHTPPYVKVNLNENKAEGGIKFFASYTYVDNEERGSILKKYSEYKLPIHQVQRLTVPAKNTSVSIDLTRFDHVVKKLAWNTLPGFERACITLNGKTLVPWIHRSFFQKMQGDRRYSYSFMPNPEEVWSSTNRGYMDFSRLNQATLEMTFDNADETREVSVFAINHNVLVFKNGLCALEY